MVISGCIAPLHMGNAWLFIAQHCTAFMALLDNMEFNNMGTPHLFGSFKLALQGCNALLSLAGVAPDAVTLRVDSRNLSLNSRQQAQCTGVRHAQL